MNIALVVGATGLVGKQCLYKLLENEHFAHVVTLVRKEITIAHPKLTQLSIDFNQLHSVQLPMQVTHVFCCLGTTMKKAGSEQAFRKVDYTYVVETAKLALRYQAKHFLLVSSIGANINSPIFYSRVKAETENAVINLGYDSVTIFRPSLLLGDREEFRLGERIGVFLAQFLGFLFIGSLAKYKGVHASKVADTMIKQATLGHTGLKIIENQEIISHQP